MYLGEVYHSLPCSFKYFLGKKKFKKQAGHRLGRVGPPKNGRAAGWPIFNSGEKNRVRLGSKPVGSGRVSEFWPVFNYCINLSHGFHAYIFPIHLKSTVHLSFEKISIKPEETKSFRLRWSSKSREKLRNFWCSFHLLVDKMWGLAMVGCSLVD